MAVWGVACCAVAFSTHNSVERLLSVLALFNLSTLHTFVFSAFFLLTWIDVLDVVKTRNPHDRLTSQLELFVHVLPLSAYGLRLADIAPLAADQFGAQVYPLRYFQWGLSTPTMLLLLDSVCRSGRSVVVPAIVDVVMVATGYIANWSPWWPAWFTASCLSFAYVMKWQYDTVSIGINNAVHPSDVGVLRTVRVVTFVTWCVFPTVWLLRSLGVINSDTAEALTCSCDFLAKLVHSSILQTSGFMRLDRVDAAQHLTDESVITDTGTTTERIGQMARMVKAAASSQSSTLQMRSLGTLSHELRTPLNAIVGYNAMLLDSPVSADQKQSVYMALTSARRLEGVVSNVVMFSDIQRNGDMSCVEAVFDIEAELDAILANLAYRGVDKHVGLRVEMGPHVPSGVHGPRQHYTMILTNIIANAIDACSEHDTVTLRVRCVEGHHEAVLDTRQRIVTEVIDTGCGMVDDPAHSVFEPYVGFASSGDTTTTTTTNNNNNNNAPPEMSEGVGLGLTVARALSRSNNGDVTLVSSQRGVGSTFQLELPFAPVSGSLEFATRLARRARSLASGSTAVAEVTLQEPHLAAHTTALLERLGIRTRSGTSGPSPSPQGGGGEPGEAGTSEGGTPSSFGAQVGGLGDTRAGFVVTTLEDMEPGSSTEPGSSVKAVNVHLRRAKRPTVVLLTPLESALLSATEDGQSSSSASKYPGCVKFLVYPFTLRRMYKVCCCVWIRA